MLKLNNFLKVFAVCHLILLQIQLALSEHHTRIVGGAPATIADAPYMLQLRSKGKFYCGATLIEDDYAISAAHCFKDIPMESYHVVGGATTVTETGISSRISKLFIPKGYIPGKFHVDIAVLKLETPLVDPSVRPAPKCTKIPHHGDPVQLFGWGQLEEDNKVLPTALHTVNVTVLHEDLCWQMYGRKMTASMFCAGAPGKDTCTGDSGGAAMVNGEHCGVVSWGIGCGREKLAGVYTSIPYMMPFLQSVMAY